MTDEQFTEMMQALKRLELDGAKRRGYLGLIALATGLQAMLLALWIFGAITVKFEPLIGSGF